MRIPTESARFKKIAVIFLGFFFCGQLSVPMNSFATCDKPGDFALPVITVTWDTGVDNYFSSGTTSVGYGLSRTCPSGCCWNAEVRIDNVEYLIDGSSYTGHSLPEGTHTALVAFLVNNGSGDPAYYQEQHYSSSKVFFVDSTPPSITFTKPDSNISISTTDVFIAGNISDPASKLGRVEVGLGFGDYNCRFKKDLFGAAVDSASIHGVYCGSSSWWSDCDVDIGTMPDFAINYDLRDYADFSNGQDCMFYIFVKAVDRVGSGSATNIKSNYNIIDQSPPVIQISSWPVVSSSGPVTAIAGTATDSSEIMYVNFKLEQTDRSLVKTYWNGTLWAENASTVVNIDIPAGASSTTWSYTGLTAKDVISGSHYKLTVYAADKFEHASVAQTEFDYNTCSPVVSEAVAYTGEDVFEVGSAAFRQLNIQFPFNIVNSVGHAGIYVVSDSQYAQKNGPGIEDFRTRLRSYQKLLPIDGSDSNHFIVQADGNCYDADNKFVKCNGIVNFVTKDTFMQGGAVDYWGPRDGPGLTPEKRDTIAYYAALQLGLPYVNELISPDWAGGNGPEPVAFRCDGLVVYSYHQANIDLDQGPFNWPQRLGVEVMRPTAFSRPAVSTPVITAEGDSFKIAVDARDAESGIDRVEYFLSTSLDFLDAGFLGALEQDSLSQKNYSLDSTCNPGDNLLVRAVDRAGNWNLIDSKQILVSGSHELKNYPIPSRSLVPPVPDPIRPDLPPLDIRRLSEQAYWYFKDNDTATGNLLAFYAIDLPFDSWSGTGVSAVLGGKSNVQFSAGPGTHTFYLAIMDESGNFAFQTENFTPPDLQNLFASAKTAQAGDAVALFFENETAPGAYGAEKLVVTWPTPEGYLNSPATSAYDITTTAQYSGGIGLMVKIDSQNLGYDDIKHLHLLHLNNGVWEDTTAGVDSVNGIIFGYATTLSPFAIYSSAESVPEKNFPDRRPPRTEIMVEGHKYTDSDGKKYVSSSTYLNLIGLDDHVGNISTYYKLDVSQELAAAGLKPETTGQFSLYSTKFLTPEGRHIIGYGSVDASGNYEVLKTTTFYIDGTPPVTSMIISSAPMSDNGMAYINEGDSVTLSAVDPISNDVFSGVKNIFFLVDASPESCQGEPDLTGPAGTCRNPRYPEPFSLPVGTHTVYYSAMDNVGNKAGMKSVNIKVNKTMPFPKGYGFSRKFPIDGKYFVTRDAAGNIYVASYLEISKYSSTGTFITKWGSYGTGPGQFVRISGIRAGPDGNIYTVDVNKIQKFTSDGVYLSEIKGMFSNLQGLDIDKSGNLYAADYSLGKVVVISTGGAVLKRISAPGCLDVAVDEHTNVYVADIINKAVKKFSSEGILLTTYGPQAGAAPLQSPLSVEVDPYGNVYVADIYDTARMVVFNNAGNYLGEIGTVNTTPGGVIGRGSFKMELDKENGELYVPQGTTLFIYQVRETLPALKIISPSNNSTVFHDQILVYAQSEPGAKVEVFDGEAIIGSGYIDNIEGGFKTTVPLVPGAHAISAKAVSNLGFEAERSLLININVQSLRPAAFSQATALPVAGYPYAQVIATTTVTGDFNGDGLADIIAIGKYSYTVLLGRGDGSFSEQLSVNYVPYYFMEAPPGSTIWKAIAEDVNKDGKLDFVLDSWDRVITGLGYGDGTFKIVYSGFTGSTCNQQNIIDIDIESGDVNGDGYKDVVKSARTGQGGCLYVFAGDGTGNLTLVDSKFDSNSNDLIAIKDFDQDGKLDIANGRGVYWNDGSGRLNNYQQMCATCTKVISADINADGLWDLIYDYRFIRFNIGNGAFGSPVVWDLNWQGNNVIGKPVISDFNGDGIPDVAVGVGKTNDYGRLFVYLGYGDGLFAPDPVNLYVGNNYSQIDTLSIGDFNNDTRNDIVTALHFNTTYLTPELALFFNNTQIPDIVPPSSSAVALAINYDGGVSLSWRAPGDDGSRGKAARYELGFATVPIINETIFGSADKLSGLPAPQTAGSVETFVVSEFLGGATYYFALKTYDEAGNVSGLSNTPSIFVHYVVKSTQSVSNNPEITLISKIKPVLTLLSTASSAGSTAMELAVTQDLSPVSNMFEIGFEGLYDYSGVLSFRYSAAAVVDQGLIESEIGAYEYYADTGWVKLAGQVLDTTGKKIIVPVNTTSSVCGIFGSGPKLLSPVENAELYTETPLFLGRICKNCSLRISENGIVKGEIAAQADGFLKGTLNFPPGEHTITAETVENGVLFPVTITRKFSVHSPYAFSFDVPVLISSDTRFNVGANTGSSGVGVADFNGDNHDDLLVFGPSSYVVALGNGAGQFVYLNPVSAALNHLYRVENPDLNNDGKTDIVGGNIYKGLTANYGGGDGTFGGFLNLPNQLSLADAIKCGDSDKDGYVDVAVAGYDSGTAKYAVSLLKNQDGVSFIRKHLSTPVQASGNINFAEMDVDNKTDIIHGGTVFYGDGQGNFPYVKTFAPNCSQSLIGDFNKDGYNDFACLRQYSMFVDIYISLKNRTFKNAQSIELPISPIEAVAVTDMNNDGQEDLIIGSSLGRMCILASKGDGSFAAPFVINVDSRIDSVKIVKTGDFNEDGKKDLVIGHYFAPIYPEDVTIVYNRSEGIDRIPPGMVSNFNASFEETKGSVILTWTAPGDDGYRGKAAAYDLRFATAPITDINFNQTGSIANVPEPKVTGSSETFAVPDLVVGATYYFALKTTDEAGNVSGLSNSPGVFIKFVARSTTTIDGKPEIILSAYQQMSVIPVDAASSAGGVALGTAAAQGLFIISNLYDLLPEGSYEPPAMLTFYYSTAALAGIPEDELAVYEHFPDEGWVRLEGQTLDTVNHKITVPVSRIASLFGIFWDVRDLAAPQTRLLVSGASWLDEAGKTYMSGKSSITFEAYDPVAYDTATGVAFTEYRVDPDTSTPFVLYTSPFTLSPGTHNVEFRSQDNAGNLETARSTMSFVDGEAPVVRFEVAGASFSAGGVLYAAPGSTVTLISVDGASGVKALYYSVNGGTYTASSGLAELFLSLGGSYAVNYSAEDNVANVSLDKTLAIYIDTDAPVSVVTMSGVAGSNGWYVSGVDAAIGALDEHAGVRETLYRLDGSGFAVYGSSFAVLAEGRHVLEAYSIDNVANIETAKIIAFNIDVSTPITGYSRVPAPNTDGWNNAPVEVIFTGTDAVSGIEYCSSSFTIISEGKNIPVSGYCMDYAGWSSTASSTVNIDTTAPDATYTTEPVSNETGWNNSDVAVKFTCADGLSGVKSCPADMLLAGEGLNVSTSAAVYDYAGNAKSILVSGVNIDKAAPVSTAAVSGVYCNGWYSSPATIVLASTDALSGIQGVFYSLDGANYAAYMQPVVVSSEGNHIVSYYGEDKAGNRESVKTIEFGIDTTAPVADYLPSPLPNAGGWNAGAVNLVFRGSDTLSGIEECSSMTVTAEGKDQKIAGWCRDLAGNAGYSTATLNIDLTQPVVSAAQVPVPNTYGWNNGAVEVSFVGADALSGIAYCEPAKIISVEGASQTVSGYCMDYAGWSSTRAIIVNIDNTAPATRAELSGHIENGWYTGAVLITLIASDEVSGVKQTAYRLERQAGDGAELVSSGTYAAPLSAVSDGIYTVRYYAEDKAGNNEVEQSLEFKIDSAPPDISYGLIPEANADGWNNSVVEVVFRATNTLSGIKECSRVAVVTEGAGQKIAGYCSDMAGNIAYATATVNIDFTGPVSSASQNPVPNAAGWNNSDVRVVFAGSDNLSGFAYCSPEKTVSAEGASQTVSGYCADYAGNSSTASITLNIDKTAPLITISSPVAGSLFAAGNDKIEIRLAVDDNLDPVPTVIAVLTQTEDKGAPRGSGPASMAVANGRIVDPLELDDGLWLLEVVAKDIAGNSTQVVSGLFEVIHDTIAPETILLVGEPKFTDAATFINSGTPLTFSTTDDLLINGDRQGSGAASTYISLDGGTPAATPAEFFIPLEGAHSLAYYSVDKAGNTEASKSAQLSVDNSAPETSRSITGPAFTSAAGLYVSTVSVISFSAVEPPSAGAASGFAAIFIADSTDTYTVYSASFTASEGVHLYSYYAKDRLGNTEPLKNLALTADGTPPVSSIIFSSAPASGASGRLIISSDTYIGFAAQDAFSGVAAVWYSMDGATAAVVAGTITLPVGLHEISYWAADNVGNSETARKVSLQVGAALQTVSINFEPSVVNLKSEGGYIEATLSVSSAGAAEFEAGTIRIVKINDVALAAPIYAIAEHEDKDKGKDEDKGKGKDRDKKKDEDRHEKPQIIKVKFDRQALIAVLPVDRMVKVTVEGSFDDDTAFVAEDYLRVINPGRVSKGHDGKVRHHSSACADIPAKALKEDADITVVAMAERDTERREREERAGAKNLKRRGEVYEFGPEGTVFDAPVVISLPYDPLEAGKEKLAIAYWNPSKKDWEPLESELDAVEKVVKAKVGHFSLYQVVAPAPATGAAAPSGSGDNPGAAVLAASGADPTFKLGEVYVFPNPAKGAEVPVFHVECGIADSVNIKIYTVSGREAHEHTLAGLPAELDDGDGLSYAYEYAWRDHIPSGIYFYHVEAKKGGQKLKKAGKFAVIR